MICEVETEMLDAFPIDVANFSVVPKDTIALEDDGPRDVSPRLGFELPMEFPEKVLLTEEDFRDKTVESEPVILSVRLLEFDGVRVRDADEYKPELEILDK